MIIFIYGVPGVGKTYFSKSLGRELNLSVVEADKIKKKLRKDKSKEEFPFLYLGTCSAFNEFGRLDEENAIKGLLSVRNALKEEVSREVLNKDNFILEGAFLDPKTLNEYGRTILLICNDEKLHKKYFYRHREKLLDFKGEEFKAARIIQEYLIKEALELSVEIIDNTTIK